ncbi:hypothetical protein CYY_002479 [Polysphondylium violaceum]|uniref:Uncharacterized protein n=1 Tax=Polysphondylium violaceum TaxID=133409 RepID=A0A8J4PY23_9MYCE|nr:hypothetical protein CYY_002479 [Polysphondylium violaceum]
MYNPEDQENREALRLSKALSGKLPSQNKKPSKWAPVNATINTKHAVGTPVNGTDANTSSGNLHSFSVSSEGVDSTSIYPTAVGIVNDASVIPTSDEKLKAEQNRLKKWGLAPTNIEEEQHNSSGSSGDNSLASSTSSLSKSSNINIAKESSSQNLLQYQSPVKVSNSVSSENLVDSTSIMSNVDSITSDEKTKQEQKRLERWGLKITTPSTPSTSSTSSTPAPTTGNTSPPTSSIPSSPFTASASSTVVSHNSNLATPAVQQFLDRIIFSSKTVKQIIHKKTTNQDVAISILMDLVKESAVFGINLSADSSMSFDISQNAGRLAGAVNELVKSQNSETGSTVNIKLYEEILSLLGLMYLSVVAN